MDSVPANSNQVLIHSSHSNALNILDERYAKGEISEEEYKKIKTEIKKS